MTGWQKFERFLAVAAGAAGIVSTVAWGVALVQGDGLWAVVGLVLGLVEVAFAVVWFRSPRRMPYWAGLVFAAVLAVPLAYANVMLQGSAAQAGSVAGLAVLVLAAMMYGRRFDQPTAAH